VLKVRFLKWYQTRAFLLNDQGFVDLNNRTDETKRIHPSREPKPIVARLCCALLILAQQ
jgi:hypothetical protein